jgi:N-dimethylarginine dimethylaminohydrolase
MLKPGLIRLSSWSQKNNRNNPSPVLMKTQATPRQTAFASEARRNPITPANNDPSKASGNGFNSKSNLTTSTRTAELKAPPGDFDFRLAVKPGKALKIQIAPGKDAEAAPLAPWLNPTQLERPAFMLNFPFSYATESANNPWMTDLSQDKRRPDFRRAAVQFLQVYREISAEGLVYLLPTPRGAKLQDLLYTANLGIVLGHLPDKNTVVISNFASPPRQGETPVGVRFFEQMGYEVHVSPAKFEGEAELKHLYDNVYVGGYGIRSEKAAYDWMERTFDMRIIKVKETEPYLYHLDCSIFPITSENTLVGTELFTRQEVRELEKVTNVIPVSTDECFSGICNSVRLPNRVLNSSHIHELKAGTEDYQHEIQKNRKLEDIAANLALELSYFNLSEFHKSGALLSCMVMHLNRRAYDIALTA